MAPTAPTATGSKQPQRIPLWLGFAAGFAIVFLGALLTINMAYMASSGDGVIGCKLWKYYAVEVPRLFSVRALGPASGGETAVFVTIAEHIAISLVGGVIGLAFAGWFNRD